MYAYADLRISWWHIPNCWKSCVAAQLCSFNSKETRKFTVNHFLKLYANISDIFLQNEILEFEISAVYLYFKGQGPEVGQGHTGEVIQGVEVEAGEGRKY